MNEALSMRLESVLYITGVQVNSLGFGWNEVLKALVVGLYEIGFASQVITN